jgi:hypothetical protein
MAHEYHGFILLIERGADRVSIGVHIPHSPSGGARRGNTTRQLHGPTTQTKGGKRFHHPAPPPSAVEDQGAVHENDLHPSYLPADARVHRRR